MIARRALALLLFCTALRAETFTSGGPATTNNDDSCDIGVAPAATLLLPYFEVELDARAETTVFTVTNVSHIPRVARVTLWTDFAFPVISFDLYLTGYDVQSIDLYEVLVHGRLPATCAGSPSAFPAALLERVRGTFTTGRAETCATAGGAHAHAIGYATVDVVRRCSSSMPLDPAYFAEEIRFDNVLIGDYVQVSGIGGHAQGNTMVHIRAVERPVNLPRTFYGRYQTAADPKRDARQPLPALFAARWVSGGAAELETHFKIWRETPAASDAVCSTYQLTTWFYAKELTRFDEEENIDGRMVPTPGLPVHEIPPILPATSRVAVTDEFIIPPNTSRAEGGWLYMNLDCRLLDLRDCPSEDLGGPPLQSWVTVSMSAAGRYSVEFDAAALGNGCSGPVEQSHNR
jgi:hypothetical protein